MKTEINIVNKKASFEYQILDKYTAGIMLLGTEIKGIRTKGANFVDAYCFFDNNELFISGLHIPHYKVGEKHDEKRHRKLLLTKRELTQLSYDFKTSGLTIVPISLITNERNIVKVNIGLAKGKRLFDKRVSLKEKEIKREIERNK